MKLLRRKSSWFNHVFYFIVVYNFNYSYYFKSPGQLGSFPMGCIFFEWQHFEKLFFQSPWHVLRFPFNFQFKVLWCTYFGLTMVHRFKSWCTYFGLTMVHRFKLFTSMEGTYCQNALRKCFFQSIPYRRSQRLPPIYLCTCAWRWIPLILSKHYSHHGVFLFLRSKGRWVGWCNVKEH